MKAPSHHPSYIPALRAADFIENNPDRYRFMQSRFPSTCNTQGCLLGWIGFFSEKGNFRNNPEDVGNWAEELVGMDDMDFYTILSDYNPEPIRLNQPWEDWHRDPATAAMVLRRFAEEHLKEKEHA